MAAGPPRADAPPVVIAVPGTAKIVVHAFPNDVRFLRDIRRAYEQLGPDPDAGGALLARMRSALRAWYPRLEIRQRDALADLSSQEVVWYALRDGEVRQPRDLIDHMHHALADARETAARSERAVERAEAALSLARSPRRHRRTVRPLAEPGDEPVDDPPGEGAAAEQASGRSQR